MKVCSKCLRPVNENAVSGWFKYRCHKCLKDFGFYSSDVTDVLICPYCGEKQPILGELRRQANGWITERG